MKELIKKSYPVTGMSCASCALTVENTIKNQEGVNDASVNFAANTISIEFNPSVINTGKFKSTLQSSGYDLLDENISAADLEKITVRESDILKRNTLWAAVLTIPVVIIGMFLPYKPLFGIVMLVLSAPVTFWFGRRFFITAVRQLTHGQVNMDTLVALSTSIAWLFSLFNLLFPEYLGSHGKHPQIYFEASSVIIVFILLGRLLEEKAKSDTSFALKKLIGLQPDTVSLVQEDDREIILPVSQVRVNDRIRIKPGERIPVDGIIITGSSSVDESTITGESLPAEKQSGDTVYSGTINQKGSFIIEAGKIGGDTLLSRIIQTVRDAQNSKPPVQKLVDKVAAVFVPVVILLAIFSFTAWMIAGKGDSLPLAIQTMVSVLIIACPCALGLATPTAIMVGIGKGATQGILIKDAEGLEIACKVNSVVFDKTGTITNGKPEVTDLIWKTDALFLSKVLYGLEMHSEHPLADAVTDKLKTEGVSPVMSEDFEAFPGKGITGEYQGYKYAAGNEKLMAELQISLSESDQEVVFQFRQQAKTVVFFSKSKEIVAIIAIADKIRSSSQEAIGKLRKEGLEIHMLTGDNENTAGAIASQAGITTIKAGLLPSEKAEYVTGLQEKGRVVAMVGDGINDSQAMALADVSFAMGKGSDIAMDVAKMTIVTSDLNAIPAAIRLSKLTLRTIRQNLFWAFIYNLIAIPIAAGLLYPFTGFMLNPMIAGAAMAMSSVSVVSNSLRLKYKKV
jgi:P-type Cu2+ transporter